VHKKVSVPPYPFPLGFFSLSVCFLALQRHSCGCGDTFATKKKMLTHVTTATVMIPAMRAFHFAVVTEEPDAASTA